MSMNLGVVIDAYVLSKIFSKARKNAMSMKNIMSGFKVFGIFTEDALKVSFQQQSESVDELAKKSDVAYIPFFTQSKVKKICEEHSTSPCSSIFSSSINWLSSLSSRWVKPTHNACSFSKRRTVSKTKESEPRESLSEG